MNDGACLILVEKNICNDNYTNEMFVDLYYDIKRRNGYTEEQIEAKKKSLRGILVPVKERWNVELLKDAGFKHIDAFWKCLNFSGYIAIK